MAATPYQAYKTCVKTVKYPKDFALQEGDEFVNPREHR
ncbi:hypothetical protein [Salmonella enterica subsp. enterica serovar Rissen]|nr:hypothetical protein [Salmonella enterica subsp. enterica serovar Rissen]